MEKILSHFPQDIREKIIEEVKELMAADTEKKPAEVSSDIKNFTAILSDKERTFKSKSV